MTPGFSGLPLKTSSYDGRNFVLLEPFSFTNASGVTYTVPVGSESDGASTPPELWPTIPPFGKYWPAAYLHDYLYRYTQVPKHEADVALLDGMKALDVDVILRDTIYEGVHLGGQSSFEEDRKKQAVLLSGTTKSF